MVLPGLEHPLLVSHVILTQIFLEEAKKGRFCKDFLVLLLPHLDLLL